MRSDQRQRGWGGALDPPGLAEARGPRGEELRLQLIREAGKARVVEIVGDRQGLAAAIPGDVLVLAVEIDRVFGVGLEAAGELGRDRREVGPDARQCIEAKIWLGGEFEGR